MRPNPVPEFECIQRNNVPEQARLEMELVPFTGAIHHPDRLETRVREALMTGMPRHLSIEATAAKLSIPLPRRTVADDVVVGRALATPLALHLSHAAQPFCHGRSSITAESRFGMSVTINALSPPRSTSCISCPIRRGRNRSGPPLGPHDASSAPARPHGNEPSPPAAA